jgi:hypothetical protein
MAKVSVFLRTSLVALGLGLVGLAALSVRVSAANNAVDTSDCILLRTFPDGRRLFLCPPELNPTATPRPTQTTAPSTPTTVPVPTVVGQPIAPYADAPLCPTHDPRAYHALWDPVRGCHYDHFHGDDPHSVDDIFGTAYYGWAGGSISYPWQTVNSTTGCLENDCKHTGYVWLVRRDQGCFSQFGTGCVTDFRAQLHAMSSAHDTSVRYHSAWVEMRVCPLGQPDNCGIFRSGGWQDTGDLMIDEAPVIDVPNNYNRFKLHYATAGNPSFGTWYSGSPGGQEQRGGLWSVVVELGDMWGPLDPADPTRLQFFCPDPMTNCRNNGSRYQPHVIALGIPPRFVPIVDPDGDGFADYEGYANRYGEPVSGCTAPGLDCVPLILEHVPMGYEYQGRFDYREYDITFGGQTSGWIQYQH